MAAGLRPKASIDYRALLGLKSKSRESAPDNMDEVVLDVDKDGEKALLGDVMDSDEEFDGGEFDLDSEAILDNLDSEQILELAKEEERKCAKLEAEVDQRKKEEADRLLLNRQREEERRKQQLKVREALKKLKAARSRRVSLEKSLQETPGNSPVMSPTRRTQTSTPQKLPSGQKGEEGHALPPPPINRGMEQVSVDTESMLASEILGVIHDLQSGNAAPFTKLMAESMHSTHVNENKPVLKKAGSLPNVAFDTKEISHALTDPNVLRMSSSLLTQGPLCAQNCEDNTSGQLTQYVSSEAHPIKVSQGFRLDNNSKSTWGNERGILQKCFDFNNHADNVVDVKQAGRKYEDLTDREVEETRKRGKPLKSGILTKPDEAGIMKVVSYAHEKLSRVHVKKRVFDEIPFHFLVAGELELILDDNTSAEERLARLSILCTLAYHKHYLDVEDLKDQYDVVLKEVERGIAGWRDYDKLVSELHVNLTFRANVKAWEWDTLAMAKGDRVSEVKKVGSSDKTKDRDVGQKIFYCGDYNKDVCPFSDHHEGIFNRKTVWKWHICRNCFIKENKVKRFHKEIDQECLYVSA